jgi:hypothetical protein
MSRHFSPISPIRGIRNFIRGKRWGLTTLTNTVGYSSREGRDGAFNSGSTQGMAASYDRLAELLTSTSA